MRDFEPVLTVDDVWDGNPIAGIANHRGGPHRYMVRWSERKQAFSEDYLLVPIDEETRDLELERWGIWLRWEEAFQRGLTTIETHPCLPEDRARYEEIEERIGPTPGVDEAFEASRSRQGGEPAGGFLRRAEFRPSDATGGPPWLEVRWSAIADPSAGEGTLGD